MASRVLRCGRATLDASTQCASRVNACSAEFAWIVLTANVGLPHRSTREAIALAIHLVVHIARQDGRRAVTEVVGLRRYDAQNEQFMLEAWSAGT